MKIKYLIIEGFAKFKSKMSIAPIPISCAFAGQGMDCNASPLVYIIQSVHIQDIHVLLLHSQLEHGNNPLILSVLQHVTQGALHWMVRIAPNKPGDPALSFLAPGRLRRHTNFLSPLARRIWKG